MYVEFDTLPEDSRIWIYQSNRKFTDEETFENALVKWFDMSVASRQQLRQNAVQSADKFSTRTFADRVEKLYENVCELREMVLRAC